MTDAEILAVADEWAEEPGRCDFDRNGFISCVRALLARYGEKPARPMDTSQPPMDISSGHKEQPAASAEPDGYFYQWELDRSKKAYPNGFPDAVPVYTAPVATQPSVPEPLKYGGERNDLYVTGWNDCAAAMIAASPAPQADDPPPKEPL